MQNDQSLKDFLPSEESETKMLQIKSSKKGFVYGSSDPNAPKIINSLDVAWWYNWNMYPQVTTSQISASIPFTPMVWGAKTANNPAIMQKLAQQNIEGQGNELLCFNEPDFIQQSNLTVDQVIDMWPTMMKTGKRLGSPAVAKSATDPNAWLGQFMKKIKELNYKVDFITIHWYGPAKPSSMINYIDTIYAQYNLPIWITEFAPADWDAKVSSKWSVTDVSNFMAQVLPAFESRKYVEKYSWKTRSTSDIFMGTSALFNDDGSLTALGLQYKNFKP